MAQELISGKELHHVGKQCAEPSCRQLDFLPTPCPYCRLVFCQTHYSLKESSNAKTLPQDKGHNCSQSHSRVVDRKALTCPLCSQVVPVSRVNGQDPNDAVNKHIDAGCPKEQGSSTGPAFSNICSLKGCSKKELVPIVCPECTLKYCIRHRLAADHQCPGCVSFVFVKRIIDYTLCRKPAQRSVLGWAALQRLGQSSSSIPSNANG